MCPCSSGKLLAACCAPFHLGQTHPRTAKQLMRARYSAFALGGLGDYLLQSWHPQTAPQISMEELGATDTDWVKLEILDNQQRGDTATVEFRASWRDEEGVIQVHHEKSTFDPNAYTLRN